MQVLKTPAEVRETLAGARGKSIGLVPTMGYLHEGHATLMRRARQQNDVVVVSNFVNPLQFGPSEDLDKYPRDLPNDLQIAAEAGADFMFHPDAAAMYPAGFSTRVSLSGVSEPFDGAARPGHFTGVATVVLKLFNIVQPTRAYFGEKDWQQLAVIRRMVADLNVPVDIQGVPIVRQSGGDADGLALSSRNSYLSDEQKARATVLSRALKAVQQAYAAGERRTAVLRQAGLDILATEPEAQADYLSVVDGDLQEPETIEADAFARVLVAARLFGVRLIDNMPLRG